MHLYTHYRHSVVAAGNEAVYELVVNVAANQHDIDEIASALRGLITPPAR